MIDSVLNFCSAAQSSSQAGSSLEPVKSVLSKAYGAPLYEHANFFVLTEKPEHMRKGCYFVIQKNMLLPTMFYITELGLKIDIEIHNSSRFCQYLAELQQQGNCLSLTPGQIVALIASAESDFVPEDPAILIDAFERECYQSDSIVMYNENKEHYFLQLGALISYMQATLISWYYDPTETNETSILNASLTMFMKRLKSRFFKQDPQVFDHSKHLLAELCYIFTHDVSRQYRLNFAYLCSQMGQCGTGALASIVEVSIEIKYGKHDDLPGWFAGLREYIFNCLIQEHIKRKRTSTGMSIHLAAYFRPLATKAGFNLYDKPDVSNHIKDTVSEARLKIDAGTPAWFEDAFRDKFNRAAIITAITARFVQELESHSINDFNGIKDFEHLIEEGQSALSLLFTMPIQNLRSSQLFTFPDVRLRSFPERSLRSYVERLLILKGYISEERPIVLSIDADIAGNKLIFTFNKRTASRAELLQLMHEILGSVNKTLAAPEKHLKVPRRIIRGNQLTIYGLPARPLPWYLMLLSASDVVSEFELDRSSFHEVLDKLTKSGLMHNKEASFLNERLDSTQRMLPEGGRYDSINPYYCVRNEQEALALLEWRDYDCREPAFLSLARHCSGDNVILWSIKQNAVKFITALLTHPHLDEIREHNRELFLGAIDCTLAETLFSDAVTSERAGSLALLSFLNGGSVLSTHPVGHELQDAEKANKCPVDDRICDAPGTSSSVLPSVGQFSFFNQGASDSNSDRSERIIMPGTR